MSDVDQVQIEDLLRQTLHERAGAMVVRPPAWDDVVAAGGRRPRQQRLATALAVAAAITVLAATVVLIGRGHEPRVVTSAPPPPPNQVAEFKTIDHRPTGPVVTLHEEGEGSERWRVIAYPTNLGPCIGIQAVDPARRPVTSARGFPAASSECVLDGVERLVAFSVFMPAAEFDSAGVRSSGDLFVMGFTTEPRGDVRMQRQDGAAERGAPAWAVPFAPGLRAFAARAVAADAITTIKVRVGKGEGVFVHAAFRVGSGPGVFVAESDNALVLAHQDGEFVCLDVQSPGRNRSRAGACGRNGARLVLGQGGAATLVVGTAAHTTKEVQLVGEDGQVLAHMPTVGCEAGYPWCFYAYEGPPLAFKSVTELP
jgi:hypothetical protein